MRGEKKMSKQKRNRRTDVYRGLTGSEEAYLRRSLKYGHLTDPLDRKYPKFKKRGK